MKRPRIWGALTLLLLAASCATTPRGSLHLPDGAPDFSLLPPGANVYLWADTQAARPVLEILSLGGLNSRDAAQILDRTTAVMAGFYPPGGEQSFYLAGQGNYPSGGARFSMGLSGDWSRIRSAAGGRYWHSASANLGVALGPHLAMVSDGDPLSVSSAAGEETLVPQGFEDFRRPLALAGWLGNPLSTLDSFMAFLGLPLQIPAQEFYFGLDSPSPYEYEMVLMIKADSPSQAGSLLALFSTARFFLLSAMSLQGADTPVLPIQEAGALLFSNLPRQEGDSLILRTPALDLDHIALLFFLFSLQ
ncbi:MAG: hypothetical protein FWH12_04920 [Treponema sp.]|nr:hypothetical protein [Treponema sp.]